MDNILQLCHSYGAPFDEVARQWRITYDAFNVITVILTGKKDTRVAAKIGGKVIFLEFKSKDIKGLKLRQKCIIKKLHKRYQFRLCIAHRYKPIDIACSVKHLSVIGVIHAYGVFNRISRRQLVYRKREQLRLVGVSNAISNNIAKHLPHFAKTSIHTVYNRIDHNKHLQHLESKEAARAQLGLPMDTTIIGNVGRLHPDKDQKTLINGFKIWSEHNQGILAIIGEGSLKHELEQLTLKLNIEHKVVFLGAIPECWKYFKAFDYFVLSSYYEPFGMVLLEAMIASVPILSSNAGGAPEVIATIGETFEVSNADDLALKLNELTQTTHDAQQSIQRIVDYFSDSAAKRAVIEQGLMP